MKTTLASRMRSVFREQVATKAPPRTRRYWSGVFGTCNQAYVHRIGIEMNYDFARDVQSNQSAQADVVRERVNIPASVLRAAGLDTEKLVHCRVVGPGVIQVERVDPQPKGTN